jgi:hypothetical protein
MWEGAGDLAARARKNSDNHQRKPIAKNVTSEIKFFQQTGANKQRAIDVFNSYDRDRNGYIDLEEFGKALGKVNLGHMDDTAVNLLFKKYASPKGELFFDQFQNIISDQLNKKPRKQSNLRRFQKAKTGFRLLKAVMARPKHEMIETIESTMDMFKAGKVRRFRTDSIVNNLRMQGNAEMYTMHALQERNNLRGNSMVNHIISAFWDSIDMLKVDNTLLKDSYVELNVKLHLATVEDITPEECKWSAEMDWVRDAGKDDDADCK